MFFYQIFCLPCMLTLLNSFFSKRVEFHKHVGRNFSEFFFFFFCKVTPYMDYQMVNNWRNWYINTSFLFSSRNYIENYFWFSMFKRQSNSFMRFNGWLSLLVQIIVSSFPWLYRVRLGLCYVIKTGNSLAIHKFQLGDSDYFPNSF